jgi:hypothetical protein
MIISSATQCYPSPHSYSAKIVEISPGHPRIVAAGGRSRTVAGGSVAAFSCPTSHAFPFPSCTRVSSLLWLRSHNRQGLYLVLFSPSNCFDRVPGCMGSVVLATVRILQEEFCIYVEKRRQQ